MKLFRVVVTDLNTRPGSNRRLQSTFIVSAPTAMDAEAALRSERPVEFSTDVEVTAEDAVGRSVCIDRTLL